MHTHAPLPQHVGLWGALVVGDPVLYAGVKERVVVFFQLHNDKFKKMQQREMICWAGVWFLSLM